MSHKTQARKSSLSFLDTKKQEQDTVQLHLFL